MTAMLQSNLVVLSFIRNNFICVKSNYRRGHETEFNWVNLALSIKLVCRQTGSEILGGGEFPKFGEKFPPPPKKMPE